MAKPSAKTIRIGVLLLILAVAGLQYLRVWRNENWVPDWEGRELVAVVVLVPEDVSEEEAELLGDIERFAFADEGRATFTALTYWFEREYKRYDDRKLFSPVHFEVVGPLAVDTLPPPPPRASDELTFSERYDRTQAFLGYYAAQRTRKPFKPKNVVFVSFYHSSQSSSFKGVHSVADRRSRSGFVFAPLSEEGVEDAIINVAHELLHLFGASDKYRGEVCAYPEGFYAPLQEPRYPQTYAEVMAQAIPVESGHREAELELFADMRVGVETAYEIGWIDRARRDVYYAGDASVGPKED